MKPTFHKTSEDTYSIIVNGKEVGRVTKTWHRNGGNGWSSPGLNKQLGKTRQEAAAKIIKSQGKTLCEVFSRP